MEQHAEPVVLEPFEAVPATLHRLYAFGWGEGRDEGEGDRAPVVGPLL